METVRTTSRIEVDLWARFQAECQRHDLTQTDGLHQAIALWLARPEGQDTPALAELSARIDQLEAQAITNDETMAAIADLENEIAQLKQQLAFVSTNQRPPMTGPTEELYRPGNERNIRLIEQNRNSDGQPTIDRYQLSADGVEYDEDTVPLPPKRAPGDKYSKADGITLLTVKQAHDRATNERFYLNSIQQFKRLDDTRLHLLGFKRIDVPSGLRDNSLARFIDIRIERANAKFK